MKFKIVVLLLLLGVSAMAASDVITAGMTRRLRVREKASSLTATYTYFTRPILFTSLPAAFRSAARADRKDILIYTTAGATLNRWVEADSVLNVCDAGNTSARDWIVETGNGTLYANNAATWTNWGCTWVDLCEQSSGNATDAAGGATGTATSLTYQQAGQLGYAYEMYSGSTLSKVAWSVSFAAYPSITMKAWANPHSVMSYPMIFAAGGTGRDLRLQSNSGKPEWVTTSNAGPVYSSSVVGSWTFITGRADSSSTANNAVLNVNNETKISATSNISWAGWTSFLAGARSSSLPFDGLLNRMMIWNRNLSDAEIADIYGYESNPSSKITVTTWPVITGVTGDGTVASPWIISGTGFEPATTDATVSVGGVACTINSGTDTQVSATRGDGTPTGSRLLTLTNSDTETDTLTITVSVPKPTYTWTSAICTVGVAFSQDPTRGGATADSAKMTGLPTGLTCTKTGANIGRVSGTVTAQTYAKAGYQCIAYSAGGNDTSYDTITVNCYSPTISYADLVCTTTVAITPQDPTLGGATADSITAATLPTGLSIAKTGANIGRISGTPTIAAAKTGFAVVAWKNGAVCAATTYDSITVILHRPGPLSYASSPAVCSTGTYYGTYSFPITAGGTATYTVSPSLPAGLSLNAASGLISGNPTAAAVKTGYMVKGTNATASDSCYDTITVILGRPIFSYTANPASWKIGAAIATDSAVQTGGAIDSFKVVSGALPHGISLSKTTGSLTGTPDSVTSSRTATIRAWNATDSVSVVLTATVFQKFGKADCDAFACYRNDTWRNCINKKPPFRTKSNR